MNPGVKGNVFTFFYFAARWFVHLPGRIQSLKGVELLALAAAPRKAAPAAKRSLWHWMLHLGGPGLILLGILDNSVIPLPGSVDVATIILAAHRREPWFFYTFMATVGAVLGGYLTFRVAQKTGKEALEKKFSKRRVQKVYATFEKWGFAAVAIPAILPPPFPIVPMLLAAGALQYPTKKILAALTVGRGIRYSILGFLGARYGRHIVSFFSQYYEPTLIILISLALIGGLLAAFQYWRSRRHSKPKLPRPAAVKQKTA